MRNTKMKSLLGLAMAAAVLSSCSGLKSMKKNADDISFNVEPTPLVLKSGEVGVDITGIFPEKYFSKKVTLEATPILKYADGETAYEPVMVQGEKVTANNSVIEYKEGGNFSYNDAVPFKEGMRKSELYVSIVGKKGKKEVEFDDIKVADGVISTVEMAMNNPKTIVGIQGRENTTGKYDPTIDPYQRYVPEEQVADIHYDKNRSNIKRSELKGDDIAALKEYTKAADLDSKKTLKSVEVSAYASPEGELDFNTNLSEKREETSSKYVKEMLTKEEVEAQLNTKFTPEDWDGFQQLMETSNIQDKELILRVLSMYSDPEVREREIRNLSEAFTDVQEEILPQLRRAKITANVEIEGRSDAEIMAQFNQDPSQLNQAELIYGASLVDSQEEKIAYYSALVKYFPQDWRGYNNIGVVYAENGEYDKASPLFQEAEDKAPSEIIIKNNIAACAIKEGNNNDAEVLLGQAAGAGDAVNYNLAILAIKEGEYNKAAKLLAGTNTVNEGLVKMMDGDASGALRAINNADTDSWKATYLKAVIAARMAKEDVMYENLENTVKANPEAKELIATDIEFAAFADSDEFKSIID